MHCYILLKINYSILQEHQQQQPNFKNHKKIKREMLFSISTVGVNCNLIFCFMVGVSKSVINVRRVHMAPQNVPGAIKLAMTLSNTIALFCTVTILCREQRVLTGHKPKPRVAWLWLLRKLPVKQASYNPHEPSEFKSSLDP